MTRHKMSPLKRCVTKEYGNQNRIYRCRRLASTFACPNFSLDFHLWSYLKQQDRKVREENLRIEEQKRKLRIEEREEKLRFEQLRSTQTKTPLEFKEYYLDEWANMNSPVQLAEKLEEFEDFKRTLKQNLAVHL
ncbi:hypothetical protein TNCV_4130351 [Trichonephila clavipes]|nr:hypothetical protein TNCV_4130351 [Trichonephila clavipes]